MQYLNEENAVNIAAQAKDNSLSSFTTAASDTNTVSDKSPFNSPKFK